MQAAEFAAAEIKVSLVGRKCWYAYTSVGNTFQVALGRKIPRGAEDLKARAGLAARREARGAVETPADAEFDRFTGESNLLVWCSWRLDQGGSPLTSWDDQAGRAEAGVRGLVGRTVKAVTVGPGWNLQVEFTGDVMLLVFPDHVGPQASFDGNWELWRPDQAYLVGTDLTCEVIDRENRPMQLQPRQGRWRLEDEAK